MLSSFNGKPQASSRVFACACGLPLNAMPFKKVAKQRELPGVCQ